MPIKALIFDLGGVLLRTEDLRPRTQLADALGMTVQDLDSVVFGGETGYAAQLGKISAEEHWEAVRLRLKLKVDEVEPFRTTFFAGDVVDRTLLDFIRSLNPPYRTSALTNALSDTRIALAEVYKLGHVFDPLVISAEEGLMKPDRRIFELTLERCGVRAEEAIFVDDVIQNVRGAQEAGLRAVWFRSREQVIADLQRLLALPAP